VVHRPPAGVRLVLLAHNLTPMSQISANSVLPADRYPVWMLTEDGVRIAGEWALPLGGAPDAVIIWCHPLPTAGGSMESHLIRKSSWRLPALANIAVLRFNSRGTGAPGARSEGAFEANVGERFDLAAALDEVTSAGMPDPWLVGWSFGTDVILRWGNRDPVAGAVLLSPPGRWSDPADLAGWAGCGRPLTALVPELDEFANPALVAERFSVVAGAKVIGVPGARHLWVGERYARIALDGIVAAILPDRAPLPTTWSGPMGQAD
jgi:hypothetical protein